MEARFFEKGQQIKGEETKREIVGDRDDGVLSNTCR